MNVREVHKLSIDPRDTVLEWPEGVEVLATTWLRENEVKVVLLAPEDVEWHCMDETGDGTPCENTVDAPGDKCHLHD